MFLKSDNLSVFDDNDNNNNNINGLKMSDVQIQFEDNNQADHGY